METHHHHQQQQQQTKPPIISPSSSPSHEFSFTISLNSSSTTTTTNNPLNPSSSSSNCLPTKTPLTAIDLSPADEIFFHGHLLPLHFLSHRSSTHSLDSFTLPDDHHQKPINRAPEKVEENDENEDEDEDEEEDDDDDHCISFNKDVMDQIQFSENRAEEKINNSYKSKSFSLFGLSKWKKNSSGLENKEKLENDDINNNKRRKVKFDVSQIVKRYIKMVKPLLTARGGREKEMIRGGGRSQSYSFSGTVTPKQNNNYYNNNNNNNILRGRRGEYSAPASMRTSPTNSGVLLATPLNSVSVSDSTMDELHSAIQAAIAHCKNSISLPQQDLPSSLPAVV